MNSQKATFGNGCFWCTEAIFQTLKGVTRVTAGYTGGKTLNPTYAEICTGDTGHAEAIEIEFDADVLSYDELLLIFFKTHNPTTLNRQGNDVGTQYRSATFPANEQQKAEAEAAILRAQHDHSDPIVTSIEPLGEVYVAEGYHQNYWDGAGQQNRYCMAVIPPKLQKLRKSFAQRTKSLNP